MHVFIICVYVYKCVCTYVLMHALTYVCMYVLYIDAYIFVGTSPRYACLPMPIRLLSIYRVIHKSLRNFRTRLRNNQERHGRKEHINR